jgi:putative acetyltransferase
MVPLYRDPWFTFRFAEDRIIPRIHLEGIEPGSRISVIRIDPQTGQRLDVLATANVGDGGWVDFHRPIVVQAGEAFIAVPMLIRPETEQDKGAVWQVNQAAFGQDAEARLVDALRAGGFTPVSLVAACHGQVVGHILFSDLNIIAAQGTVTALALAPMAVLPDFQRMGIGSALVRRGLEICIEQGHRIVVVLGHPAFYPRFGFTAKLAECLESPFGGGPSFMAAELVPGALKGVQGRVIYSPPFNDL